MSLLGLNGSNAQTPTELSGYRIQTSIFGSGITIVRGTNRVSGNVIWLGDWNATPASSGGKLGSGKGSGGGKGGTGTYNYSASYIIAVCQGPVAGLVSTWIDKTQVAGGSGYPVFITGARGQGVWGFLQSNHPGDALGYSEIALACWENNSLGTGGNIPNYSFEIAGQGICSAISGCVDSLASDVIIFVLTDFNCANFPASMVASIGAGGGGSDVASYCLANGIVISPVIDTQQTIQTYLQEYLLVANSEAFSSEGLIKFATYGDKAVTGNGVTFTPNLGPVYSLDYDAFIVDGAKNPVTFTVEAGQDANNQLSFEWTNRARGYNLEPITDEDQDAVNKYGLNAGSVQTIHSVCNASVAQQVLSVQLKRSVYMLRKAQFTLGWAYSLLEPMDIVLVPEQFPSTGTVGVRILKITEDDKGNFACEGEVLPFPILSPVLHPKQASGGYTPGYDAIPSVTNAPIFFEATPQMLNQNLVTQLTLFIALSGGPSWGGCGVYLSTDGGNTYPNYLGQQKTASNMGFLTADYAFGADPDTANVLHVNLQESLGQPADSSKTLADNFQTLAVIDQELISYGYSNLTGPNEFSFESAGGAIYNRRGVFGSNETLHKSGAAIALLDGNQFEVPYTSEDIGKTWYFKFPSFNLSGQQVQDLADAVPYAFTLTAPYTRGPLALKPYADIYPFAPSGYSPHVAQVNGGSSVALSVTPPANAFSPTVTAPVIDYAAAVTATGGSLPQGSFVGQVFAVDANGLYSLGSNLTEFTTANLTSKITFNVTLPYGAVAYEAFFGIDIDHLIGQGKVMGTPTSLTVTSLDEPTGYGPPDSRAAAWHARGKRVIHAGIAAPTVASVTPGTIYDTIALNIPSAATANEFTGRYLIIVSKAGLPGTQSFSVQPILTSDTSVPCNVTVAHPAGALFGPGDLVIIATAATSSTASSITDTGWVSPYAPGGLTSGASVGNIIRVMFDPTGSALPGDSAIVTANSTTSHTVTPWVRQPGTGTVFIEEEPSWRADVTTTAAQNFAAPAGAAPSAVQVAVLPTAALSGYVALIQLLARDQNGNDSVELGNGFRMIYVLPQSQTTSAGAYTMTPSGGSAVVDLAHGLNHLLPLNGTAVNMVAPVWTGGMITPGLTFTLYQQQDATGGRAGATFAGGAGAFVSNTSALVSVDGTPRYLTSTTFTFLPSGYWSMDTTTTGIAPS